MVSKSSKAVQISGRARVRAAWVWTCEACGLDSFEHSIEYKATEDEIRREFELSPHEEIPEPFANGSYFCYPDVVRCDHCGSKYETRNADSTM